MGNLAGGGGGGGGGGECMVKCMGIWMSKVEG